MNITINPELYTKSNAFEGEEDLKNYHMGEYFKALSDAKVITFDSGECSKRRDYIRNTLAYLTNVKGISAMVLSCLDGQVTKSFLNKIPQKTRSKILNIGLFHVYLSTAQKVKKIMEQLYVSREYRFYMQLFFSALRAIEGDLVKQLSELGILVILDRSIISNFLYYKAITSSCKGPQWSSTFNLSQFKVLKSFYVHSGTSATGLKGTMYDTDESINHSLRALIPQVNKLGPEVIQLIETNSIEQNMAIIRTELDLL